MARAVLGLNTCVFLGVGLLFLVYPETVVSGLGLGFADSTALADFRAVYGGLEIALGVAMAWALLERPRTRMGLGLALIIWCGLTCGRMAGILLDGPQSNLGYGLLASEIVGVIVTAIALRKV